jgi:hypothetical protein
MDERDTKNEFRAAHGCAAASAARRQSEEKINENTSDPGFAPPQT